MFHCFDVIMLLIYHNNSLTHFRYAY